MRLLHVTDTHLGVDRHFRGAPAGWRRADDHLAAFRAALDPALRGEVDAVVHSGDLFDRSLPPARALEAAAALLAEVARIVPVVLTPGNHDRRGLRGHLPTPPPGLHVLDEPTHLRLGELRLAVVPFLREADAWAEAARVAWGGGADLLVAHQAFDGARVPGFTFREGTQPDTVGERHLPRGVRHVLCGHVHPRQALRVGDAEVVHPGSTERTAFSERHETKGVVHWALGDRPRWRFVDLPTRPMHVVAGPSDLDAVGPNHLVRVAAEGSDRAALEDAALARGAWVPPAPAPGSQLPLFGRA